MIKRLVKQIKGNDLLGTHKAKLERTLTMHQNETAKIASLLDNINAERTAVAKKINDNLGKGIGSLSGIGSDVKNAARVIEEQKKTGLLSSENKFFGKHNK